MNKFKPEGFSDQIFKDRYAFTSSETWEEACLRVARQMASAELASEKIEKYQSKFYEVLVDNLFVPGGRIWYNSGRPNPQLLNCFVLGNDLDSKEGWGRLSYENIVTSMTGGGCGQDFSDVRPQGATISGHRGTCPGPLELMKMINYNAKAVRAGGGRRAANMFSLDLNHPDVLSFLDAKLVKGELDMANVSVRSKETDRFIAAVRSDSDWELSWKGQYKRKVKAKDLWDIIVKNAFNSAEPGFLNMEFAEKESNIAYIEELITTNPCVSGDTQILTRAGYKEIESLVGRETEVWNGFEWSKVTPQVTGVNQEMLEVTFSNGRKLKCTKYHGFMITADFNKSFEKIQAKDLTVGMKLMKHDFPIIEEGKEIPEAYLQGFYAAEGMDDYKHFLIYKPKELCIKRLSNFGRVGSTNEESGRTRFAFDIVLKSKDFVPFEGNIKAKLDWLSGLFDGDGSELKEGGLQLWSVNQDFLLNLQLLLNTLGVSAKVSVGKKSETKNMPGGTYTCQDCFRLCIGAEAIQRLKRLGLSCERLKFEKQPNRAASQYVKISNIKPIGIADKVFCFNEGKRHLGVFNGVLTAQCGEIFLSAKDCCCLGHLVLTRFVKDSNVDWHFLAEVIRTGVRFLDNVLSVNSFPLPEMKAKSHKLRRIGLGTTALADMMILLGLRYGSKEGNAFIDKLYRFISKAAYEASVMLAIEKGAFPACQPDKHIESGFIKRMPKKIRALIKEHGIRNCAILTQAPTGTISILSGNCSAAIEPIFSFAYWRNYWEGEVRKRELCFHPLFKRFLDEGKDTKHFIAARELSIKDHMEVQKIVQTHMDNAVSKTINIASEFADINVMSELWLEYLPFLKGATFYREGSRNYVDAKGVEHEPPLVEIPLDEALRLYEVAKGEITIEKAAEMDCASGICELPNDRKKD